MIALEVKEARVFVRPGSTDMRKQINGLAVMAEQVMEANVHEPTLLLFGNGERRIMKALYWDRNGFCLWQKNLQESVARHHILLSQVPFYRYGIEPLQLKKIRFTDRNDTMAAISDATIIVEAGESSGTLTQARACFQRNRKLFLLNSCFENPHLTWPSIYERKGAVRVREFDDIARGLAESSPRASQLRMTRRDSGGVSTL